MGVHVVVNATAGGFRSHPLWIERMRKACDGQARLYVTWTQGELLSVTREIRGASPDLVVLCGGDGTHMAGATALAEVFGDEEIPPLCLVTGGRAGTVARNWNQHRRHPVRHVECVLRTYDRRGHLLFDSRPSLRVVDGGRRQKVGFIFGTGMVATFFDEFYLGGGGGYIEASKLVARVFAGSLLGGKLALRILEPMPCQLVIDQQSHPSAAFSLIVSSVIRDLGMHLVVTHRGGEDASRPHLVASTLGARACGMQFWRILGGKPLIGPDNVDQLVDIFRIEFPAGRGAWVLDGDLIRGDWVEVSAGPTLQIARV